MPNVSYIYIFGIEPIGEAQLTLRRRGGKMKRKDVEEERSDVKAPTLSCQHCLRLFHHRLGPASHVKHKH